MSIGTEARGKFDTHATQGPQLLARLLHMTGHQVARTEESISANVPKLLRAPNRPFPRTLRNGLHGRATRSP